MSEYTSSRRQEEVWIYVVLLALDEVLSTTAVSDGQRAAIENGFPSALRMQLRGDYDPDDDF